jgi:hypothetical protein
MIAEHRLHNFMRIKIMPEVYFNVCIVALDTVNFKKKLRNFSLFILYYRGTITKGIY